MTLSDVISKRIVFGEDAFLTGNASVTGSVTAKSAIVTDNSSSDAVRITQTGSGNALLVEDSASPDATPFVVKADGKVGVGTTSPATNFEISESGNPELRITSSNSQNPTLSFNRPIGRSYQFINELGQFKLQVATPGIDSAKTNKIFLASGTALSVFEDVGIKTFNPASALHVIGDLTMTTATTATGATAGGQSVPATAAGFLVVSINGVSRKIPYYAT
jgi:hypothetical protein